MPELRLDLDGMRVKFPNRPAIYFMDAGRRRLIPDPPTYDSLFRDWNGIFPDIDVDEIEEGAPIQSGAVLMRGLSQPKVFFLDLGHKRWITSPAVMDAYYFDWGKIHVLDQAVVNGIPDGLNIG